MLNLERHSLLRLSQEGYDQAWANHSAVYGNPTELWPKYQALPAIYTGRSTSNGLLRIGFSYPVLQGSSRCRIASDVDARFVEEAISPWVITTKAEKVFQDVYVVNALARQYGIACGIFGAAAMEIETGLPYLHRNSDLDVVIKCTNQKPLKAFYTDLLSKEQEYSFRADVELQLSEQYYCKLKELFATQHTVLCKGGEEPVLLSRRAALALLGE